MIGSSHRASRACAPVVVSLDPGVLGVLAPPVCGLYHTHYTQYAYDVLLGCRLWVVSGHKRGLGINSHALARRVGGEAPRPSVEYP